MRGDWGGGGNDPLRAWNSLDCIVPRCINGYWLNSRILGSGVGSWVDIFMFSMFLCFCCCFNIVVLLLEQCVPPGLACSRLSEGRESASEEKNEGGLRRGRERPSESLEQPRLYCTQVYKWVLVNFKNSRIGGGQLGGHFHHWKWWRHTVRGSRNTLSHKMVKTQWYELSGLIQS